MLWSLLVLLLACSSKERPASSVSPDGGTLVARFAGGVVTEDELLRAARKLPPDLRDQFSSPVGQRDLLQSLVDKKLLYQEAVRRGLVEDPEIRRQVDELLERLAIQALLAQEEKGMGAAGEPELRAYYDAHRQEFAQPERLHLARMLARVGSAASPKERAQARERAARFAKRLATGEDIAKMAVEGDGAERSQRGDLGLVSPGSLGDPALEKAAFSLAGPGSVSGVIECSEGFAVLKLLERREARVPPFEEVRAQVEGRLAPQRKRKSFDELVARLRKSGDVQVGVAARK